jgi:vitamin B12 transporter
MAVFYHPGVARFLIASAIASLSFSAIAQESPEQIAGPADPIVVTATRIPTRYNQLISDVTVVDQEQIRDYSPAEPITDVLANQPGITVRSNGGLGTSSTVQIRGAANNQTILLVDGLRLNSASSGAAPWAYIPMQQIGRMEIVRGPTSSSYGSDAIGGVIQLFTRKGEGPTKFYADAGYGTYNTSAETAGLEGSVEGFSYSVYGGNVHSVGQPSFEPGTVGYGYNQTPASYTNTNASGAFSYLLAPGQEVGIKALYGTGNNGSTWTTAQSASSPFARGAATSTENLNVLSAYSKNKIVGDWVSLIRVGSAQDNSTTVYKNNTVSTFNTQQKQAQWQHDFKVLSGNGMLAYEFLNQTLNTNSLSYSSSTYSRNINSFQAGWNGSYEKNLFQANVRNDDNSQFGSATTGSVGYGYFLLPTVRATAAWGTGFQAPTFNQLYYQGYGNPNLQPTTSENTEAGIRFNNGAIEAGVIYYYNNVTNVIQSTSQPNGTSLATNIGRSVIQGVTTSFQANPFGLNLFGSVDYQDARNVGNYTNDNKGAGQVLAYHPYVFGSLSTEKAVSDWKVGAQVQFQGSQESNPGTYTGSTKNKTLGGYALFNLYGSYEIYKDVSAIFRLNNLFDKQYQTITGSTGAYNNPGSNVFVGLRFDQR